MIRVAYRVGASIRQLAEVSGLGRKTVSAIVSSEARMHD
jgi:plasmid maintenance system antidote protein VapI